MIYIYILILYWYPDITIIRIWAFLSYQELQLKGEAIVRRENIASASMSWTGASPGVMVSKHTKHTEQPVRRAWVANGGKCVLHVFFTVFKQFKHMISIDFTCWQMDTLWCWLLCSPKLCSQFCSQSMSGLARLFVFIACCGAVLIWSDFFGSLGARPAAGRFKENPKLSTARLGT